MCTRWKKLICLSQRKMKTVIALDEEHWFHHKNIAYQENALNWIEQWAFVTCLRYCPLYVTDIWDEILGKHRVAFRPSNKLTRIKLPPRKGNDAAAWNRLRTKRRKCCHPIRHQGPVSWSMVTQCHTKINLGKNHLEKKKDNGVL